MKTSTLLQILKQLPYFTKENLSLALNKEGEDLNYWIKKLTKDQLLIPLKKGFYISPYYQDTVIKTPEQSEIYWVYLANMLKVPSYVSLEYVLSKYSLLPESTFALTSVTLKAGRTYISPPATFIYRNLKPNLYSDYQFLIFGQTGLTAKIAYPYKALFDFLYLKSFTSIPEMRHYLLDTSRINWDALNPENQQKFHTTVDQAKSVKMKHIVKILEQEKKL